MNERRMWLSGCVLALTVLALTLLAFLSTSAVGM